MIRGVQQAIYDGVEMAKIQSTMSFLPSCIALGTFHIDALLLD